MCVKAYRFKLVDGFLRLKYFVLVSSYLEGLVGVVSEVENEHHIDTFLVSRLGSWTCMFVPVKIEGLPFRFSFGRFSSFFGCFCFSCMFSLSLVLFLCPSNGFHLFSLGFCRWGYSSLLSCSFSKGQVIYEWCCCFFPRVARFFARPGFGFG